MTLSRHLLGQCAVIDDSTDVATVDVAGLVRRLLLFDTYTLYSLRLKELPRLIRVFGYDGLVALLSSKALRIYCDAISFSQIGQHPVTERRRREGRLPLGSYDFVSVSIAYWEPYIEDNLRILDSTEGIDSYRCYTLKKLVRSSLVRPTVDIGALAMQQLQVDMTNNDPVIATAVAQTLSQRLGTTVAPGDFRLRIHRLNEHDVTAESDIPDRFGLAQIDVHTVIERALSAVGSVDQRIEEMRALSAISGFRPHELPIFGQKLSFIVKSVLPEAQEEQFQRVLRIRGFPELDQIGQNTRLDAVQLLAIRETVECREFRSWLSSIHNAPDTEINERIASLRARISAFLHTRPGSDLRFLTTTALGAIPGLGIPLGILDHFLLEELLPYSGPATFLNEMYPSIFETPHADRYAGSLDYRFS